jgi:hypothetical protein
MSENHGCQNGDVYQQPRPDGDEGSSEYGRETIERLEKRTKLILILLICTLVLNAALIVLQFVRPFAERSGPSGNFPAGNFPNGDFSEGQGFGQGENG